MARPSRSKAQRSQRAASTTTDADVHTVPITQAETTRPRPQEASDVPPLERQDAVERRQGHPSSPKPAASLPTRPRAIRPQQLPHRNRRPLWIGLGALLTAVVIGGLIYVAVDNQVGSIEGTNVPDEGRTHIPITQVPEYKHYPPASGPHFDAPAPWGSIREPLPEGRFVHNLEHGGIALLYKCTVQCDTIATQVQQLYQNLPKDTRFREIKFVASPYTRMEHDFAVLAWDYIYEMDNLDTKSVESFYSAHVDKGPELVP